MRKEGLLLILLLVVILSVIIRHWQIVLVVGAILYLYNLYSKKKIQKQTEKLFERTEDWTSGFNKADEDNIIDVEYVEHKEQ